MTRLVTPCESSACIALERHPDGRLTLATTGGTGELVVTAAEVRAFTDAVKDGVFDHLLGS